MPAYAGKKAYGSGLYEGGPAAPTWLPLMEGRQRAAERPRLAARPPRGKLWSPELLPFFGDVYADQVLMDGPVAYYRMDETSGTTMTDRLGFNNGTYRTTGVSLNQTGLLTGSSDAGVKSTGADYIASLPTALGALWTTGTFSLEFWMNMTGMGTSYAWLAGCEIPGTSNGFALEARSVAAGNPGIYFAYESTGSSFINTASLTDFASNRLNQVFHVVVVRQAGVNCWIYVNGAQAAVLGTSPGSQGNMTGRNAYLGTYDSTVTGSPLYQGSMDEVAIYNYPLSAAQVGLHYQLGARPVPPRIWTPPNRRPPGRPPARRGKLLAAWPQAPSDLYGDQVRMDGPLAWWRMNDAPASNFADQLGNLTTGTVSNFANARYQQGGALVGNPNYSVGFDGVGVKGNLSGSEGVLPQNQTPVTVEAWLNPSVDIGVTGNGGCFFGYGYGGQVSREFQFANSAGTVYVFSDTVNAPNNVTIPSGWPAKGVWSHVVFKWHINGTNNYEIWVNNVLVGSGTNAENLNFGTSNVLVIGSRTDSSSLYWPGGIDELAVYGYTLTAQQVTAHYKAGIGNQVNPNWPRTNPGLRQAGNRQRLTRRKVKPVEVVQAQAAPPNPAIVTPSARQAGNRGRLIRRKVKPVEVVQPQAAPVTAARQAGNRGRLLARKRARVEVVPAQAAPVNPGIVLSGSQPRRIRGLLSRSRLGRFLFPIPPPPPSVVKSPRDPLGAWLAPSRNAVGLPSDAQGAALAPSRNGVILPPTDPQAGNMGPDRTGVTF